jgi:hypothetical protein
MQDEDIKQLCNIIRETSFEIHRYHRSGHLEKIYENALVHQNFKLKNMCSTIIFDIYLFVIFVHFCG